MKPSITVIDYGIGNLFSVTRALEHCGAEVHIARSAHAIQQADRLLLPGVGAFANGMQELLSRGFEQPIREFAASGRTFLGICLGMQLMFEHSEEFGDCVGLGLIPGKVKAIPLIGSNGRVHKVPHIGWSELQPVATEWDGGLLQGVRPRSSTYFVHSYTAHPEHNAHRIADSYYDGCRIAAVIRSGNLHGCQFHPEKSGEVGLSILRNFLTLPAQEC